MNYHLIDDPLCDLDESIPCCVDCKDCKYFSDCMEIENPRCPSMDIACPYNDDGYCTLENPDENCDDYYAEVGD